MVADLRESEFEIQKNLARLEKRAQQNKTETCHVPIRSGSLPLDPEHKTAPLTQKFREVQITVCTPEAICEFATAVGWGGLR